MYTAIIQHDSSKYSLEMLMNASWVFALPKRFETPSQRYLAACVSYSIHPHKGILVPPKRFAAFSDPKFTHIPSTSTGRLLYPSDVLPTDCVPRRHILFHTRRKALLFSRG